MNIVGCLSKNKLKTRFTHETSCPCDFISCHRSSLWEFTIWSFQLESQLNSDIKKKSEMVLFAGDFCNFLIFWWIISQHAEAAALQDPSLSLKRDADRFALLHSWTLPFSRILVRA